MIFKKRAKAKEWRKDRLFNKRGLKNNDPDTNLPLYTNIFGKWIINLNTKLQDI